MAPKDRPRYKVKEINKLIEETVKICESEPVTGKSLNVNSFLLNIRDITKSLKNNEPRATAYLEAFYSELTDTLKLTKQAFTISVNANRASWIMRISIHLAYLNKELGSFFGLGNVELTYNFMNEDASNWWQMNFGDAYMAKWEGFVMAFRILFPFSSEETERLQETLCATSKTYVSAFTFDIFVSLFYPWSELLDVWRKLVCDNSGFIKNVTFDGIRELLMPYKHKPGTYAYRMSCTDFGRWVIAWVGDSGTIQQLVYKEPNFLKYLEGTKRDGRFLYSVTLMNTSAGEDSISQRGVIPDRNNVRKILPSVNVCNMCGRAQDTSQMTECRHLICNPCRSRQILAGRNPCPVCAEVYKIS